MLALIVAAALPNPSASRPPAECSASGGVQQVRQDQRAAARKLGELPPANHVLAIYREVGRCPTPVIVRYGIGSGGR